MFVKLLVLLISNVFVSFSVLVWCRSLAQKCGLQGGSEQRTNLALVSVLEHKGAVIERTYNRVRRDKSQGTRDRAHCARQQDP